MSRRKMFMVLMVGALMVLYSSTAFAAAQFYTCKVLQIGVQTNSMFIQLGDQTTGAPLNDGRSGWYGLNATKAKEMLAVVLTAMSLNKSVMAHFDWGVATPIDAITLVNTP